MSSLLIPPGILAAKNGTPDTDSSVADYVFYDERFIQARRLAGKLSDSGQLTPVRGDITAIWNRELNRACRHSPLLMHGVTTESFYFCLNIMAGSLADVESQITRIDRDLFLWTIRSNNKLKVS